MISNTLKNAVAEKDIISIKAQFYSIILSDPMFETNRFDEALEYVKCAKEICLIEGHDGEELEDESEWDDEYFDLLSSKLQDNFSMERIQQLKIVAEKIKKRKKNIEITVGNDNKNQSDDIAKNDDDLSFNNNSKKENGKHLNDDNEDYTWVFVVGGIILFLLLIKKIFGRR